MKSYGYTLICRSTCTHMHVHTHTHTVLLLHLYSHTQPSLALPPQSPATDLSIEVARAGFECLVAAGKEERVRLGNDSYHWDILEMRLAIVWEKSNGLKRLAQPSKAANVPKAQYPRRVWLRKDSEGHTCFYNRIAQRKQRQVPYSQEA